MLLRLAKSSARDSMLAALLLLCSCSSTRGPDAIAEVFGGPMSLNLRDDLAPGSKVVATVQHGDRLDVLQTRRRFVQVRTAKGAVGWTDSRQLMSTNEMRALETLTENGKALPSQGSASVFEILNVHTEPNRASPSFAQIPETGKAQVIGHKAVPRGVAVRASAVVVVKKAAKAPPKKKKDADARRIPPPPMPPAPKPPANWLDLSRREPVDDGRDRKTGEDASEPERTPGPMEDWSLIRLADGRVGWVLLRMLNLSIPDEVAQYAEGHRITSYFALADIPDEDRMKHAWLWTTNSQRGEPFEFDGFRVFTWNVRRHRYETVYRERSVTGYYPVEVARGSGEKGAGATFSLVLQTEAGPARKTYAFNGYRVSLLNQQPYSRIDPDGRTPVDPARSMQPSTSQRLPAGTWYSRLGSRIRAVFP